MTAEAEITRALGIRFIDARLLASEAKLAESIVGYATQEQIPIIVNKAAEIFHSKPEEEKAMMRQLNDDLESIKCSRHSCASRGRIDDDASIATVDSTNSFSSLRNTSGLFRKVVSFGGMRKSTNSMNSLLKNALAKAPMTNATFSKAQVLPAPDNPLLKSVSSTSAIPLKGTHAKSQVRSPTLPSCVEKRNRIARVDRLRSIMDIQVPSNRVLHKDIVPSKRRLNRDLACINSGRDWIEA